MSKNIKNFLKNINWKFIIFELVSLIVPILLLFLVDNKWFESSILVIAFIGKLIIYQKSDIVRIITDKVERIESKKTVVESSNIEKIDSGTTNIEIRASNMNLNRANISAKYNPENEKILQEFYLKMKSKIWKEIYNFLLYNQDEPILYKYFKEIQQASDIDQFNLNTKNNRYNIKIKEKLQIMDRRNQNKTIVINENGFDDIWENILEEFKLTYHKFVIDKEYAIDHLKSLIEKKEIHEVFKNREKHLKVFPDESFNTRTREKGIKSKARIRLNSYCSFGIYTDSTFGKAYRMTVQSGLGLTQNQFFFEKNGDCFVSKGNSLRYINELEWKNFMRQISAIFEELKKSILD